MSNKIGLTYKELLVRARRLPIDGSRVYGVPNGGIYVALMVCSSRPGLEMVESVVDADCIVDDIIDSGRTRERYAVSHPGKPFYALVDKLGADADLVGRWVTFPWERATRQDGPQDAVRRILQYIGEDPDREGLLETPDRVVRAYGELFRGYTVNPASVFKIFDDGACDEMVVLRGIPFTSCCEHHMMVFRGVAHVGYLPNRRIIGLSKLARLVDVFACRLQVQERLTTQVTAALMENLRPYGAGCVIEATHACMSCRGVRKDGAEMVTSSLSGLFRDDPTTRAEFLQFVRG